METLNYEPMLNAISKTLATLPFPYTVKQAPELSLGYLATNSLHIAIGDLPEEQINLLEQIPHALCSAICNALREQGLTTEVTHLNGNCSDNLLLETRDKVGDLYATIHIVAWDLGIAVTTTQYYL